MLPLSILNKYIRLSRQRPLSKSNTFDPNVMKLGHIVKYHNVFFKFDNGSYRTRLSVVMFMKIHRFKRCPLSKSNIFHQNFMKLGHIVKYHNVFFK